MQDLLLGQGGLLGAVHQYQDQGPVQLHAPFCGSLGQVQGLLQDQLLVQGLLQGQELVQGLGQVQGVLKDQGQVLVHAPLHAFPVYASHAYTSHAWQHAWLPYHAPFHAHDP